MLINADFSRRATVSGDEYQWIASPQKGVERVMLDRIGEEKARATSIVRYAPNSHFPQHQHPGGEEILVLSGTFSDEMGDYPAGWYLRNPPGSAHQPFSDPGAIIFVKLRQMPEEENRTVRADTNDPNCWQQLTDREICPLFTGGYEQVSLQRVNAGVTLFPEPIQSAELLILSGTLCTGEKRFAKGSWIRLPAGEYPEFLAGSDGVTYFEKQNHLGDVMNRSA
ncbi:cupin domain-containing protein [Microbulbifer mangrovi]|uniref:cupin domain-containing protein n=1 Tax=Microbulbifer mangrovi TaxID=927787 RepID=UPI0009907CA3|nr:cupin domain-containing protein [Microbulbifer mangrovi]